LDLRLPLYQTQEGELNSFALNSIYFPIEKPQKCFHPLFRQLLNDLWLAGIFSYHHENKLYLVFQTSSKNLLEVINNQLNAFIEEHAECFPNEYQGKKLNFADFISTIELRLSSSHKNFTIVRSIIYGYLRKIYGYKKGIVSKEESIIIYVHRVPESEDSYIFEDKFIRQGVKFMFEVTPKGRGRIWFDIVTHAFKLDEQGTRSLSPHEMKQESHRFYRKYSALAQLMPRSRYNRLMEMLNTLGIQDNIVIRYYTWDKDKQQFEERVIKFVKYLNKLT